MRSLLLVLFLATCVLQSSSADPISIPNAKGRELTIEINWASPLDLDLFVTDPTGETVYFANRVSKSGVSMQTMTGCADIATAPPPHRETVSVSQGKTGIYRVSVDFIKQCDSTAIDADFRIRLLDSKTGLQLQQGASTVTYRLLDTLSWEFEIK